VDRDCDDGQAVAAARAGDRDAFCLLVERYQEVAFRAAFLVVRDAAAAEDVAQEGFMRAYQHLREFDTTRPFRPWLLRIVTRLALNEVRGRSRRAGLLDRAGRLLAPSTPPPEGEAIEVEERDLLWRAINELPPDDRVVLYLRHFLDLPEREIAEAIGKRPGTVKSRLNRASGRLRGVIEERYPSLKPETNQARAAHG
jgi:RNA polymerase sigma-70 factor (ECF subfamily)